MLVRTDDEVYRVDSVWLGPPRATFPWRARYVSYGVGFLVMVAVMFVQRRVGIGLDFFSVAWALILTVVITRFLGKKIDYERPLGQVAELFRQEVVGPRRRRTTAGGPVRFAHVRRSRMLSSSRGRKRGSGRGASVRALQSDAAGDLTGTASVQALQRGAAGNTAGAASLQALQRGPRGDGTTGAASLQALQRGARGDGTTGAASLQALQRGARGDGTTGAASLQALQSDAAGDDRTRAASLQALQRGGRKGDPTSAASPQALQSDTDTDTPNPAPVQALQSGAPSPPPTTERRARPGAPLRDITPLRRAAPVRVRPDGTWATAAERTVVERGRNGRGEGRRGGA